MESDALLLTDRLDYRHYCPRSMRWRWDVAYCRSRWWCRRHRNVDSHWQVSDDFLRLLYVLFELSPDQNSRSSTYAYNMVIWWLLTNHSIPHCIALYLLFAVLWACERAVKHIFSMAWPFSVFPLASFSCPLARSTCAFTSGSQLTGAPGSWDVMSHVTRVVQFTVGRMS